MNIELSKYAEVSLAYILQRDKEVGNKILDQLINRLPLDPYPEDDDFNYKVFESLNKEGIEIYRLKSQKFSGYRVFYIVDDANNTIYILEITERDDKTYKPNAGHVKRIKELYLKHYTKPNTNK